MRHHRVPEIAALPVRGSRRAARLFVLVAALAVVLAACALPSRQESQTFVKPPDPPDITPFVDTAKKLASEPWGATYTIVGTDITSVLQLIFADDKGFVSTTIGGITLEIYAGFSPLTVTACAITSGVDVGCFDLSSMLASATGGSGSSGSSGGASPVPSPTASPSGSSSGGGGDLVDTITGLINVPGTTLTDENLVPPGTEAQCMTSPATKLSNEIRICFAEAGGFLYYDNGKLVIQATSYTSSPDPASLVAPPPGGGLASALG